MCHIQFYTVYKGLESKRYQPADSVTHITWTDEMNFVMNHTPGAGSMAGHVACPAVQSATTVPRTLLSQRFDHLHPVSVYPDSRVETHYGKTIRIRGHMNKPRLMTNLISISYIRFLNFGLHHGRNSSGGNELCGCIWIGYIWAYMVLGNRWGLYIETGSSAGGLLALYFGCRWLS